MANRYQIDGFGEAADPVSRLAGAIIVNALRKGSTSIDIKRVAPDHLAVFYEIDGCAREEMRPPWKLWRILMEKLCGLATINDLNVGATGRFELLDRTALRCAVEVAVSANEHGEAVQLTLVVVEPD